MGIGAVSDSFACLLDSSLLSSLDEMVYVLSYYHLLCCVWLVSLRDLLRGGRGGVDLGERGREGEKIREGEEGETEVRV